MATKVLYLHYAKNPVLHRRVLDGMRRFGRTIGWHIEPVLIAGLPAEAIRETVRSSGAVGCVLGTGGVRSDEAGRLSSLATPLVRIDPTEAKHRRRGAAAVISDNAAIAQAAYRELSAGHPPCYAAVSYWNPRQRWAKERIAAFRAICEAEGVKCTVFSQPRLEPAGKRLERLADWAAALPPHVAIFAVNDFTAVETAIALHSRHRPIPRTATLVGVDGSPERHDIPSPPVPISSVNVNFESAGFLAAKMLASKISRPREATTATFGPLMVVRRESTRGRGRHERYILEAAEMIRREAFEGLTAAELAARFPVSRTHFERRFREATGHSVLDEILNIRLEQVQSYLLRRDVAIDAIAGFCGFGSEIELRRLFRRRFGVSMTQWRAANRT